MISRRALVFTIMGVAIVTLFVVDMTTGSSVLSVGEVWSALLGDSDPSTVKIVCGIRLTKAIVAIIAGLALAVSGLQMQTLFCNPLAGPYVLGITSGASLGVALFILGASAFGIGDALGFFGDFGVAGAALAGAALVLAVIAAVGSRIKDIMVILILGMMFSSGIGAIVQILQYLSHEDALKAYVVWTMGSLGDVTSDQLIILAVASFAGLILAVAAIKPLNLLMLVEQYAVTMVLNLRRSLVLLFASTTLLAGSVTAFCGPIGFIGLAAPHVARRLWAEADCRVLLPASAVTGVAMMLLCDIVSKSLILPVNTVAALLGIPIVIWIVLKIKQ